MTPPILACFRARSLGYDLGVELPGYWMPRPGPAPDAATRAEFDRVLDEAVLAGPDQFIDYRMAAPKWQFLCYAADRGGFVLHGTGNPDIATFEPRHPMMSTPSAIVVPFTRRATASGRCTSRSWIAIGTTWV